MSGSMSRVTSPLCCDPYLGCSLSPTLHPFTDFSALASLCSLTHFFIFSSPSSLLLSLSLSLFFPQSLEDLEEAKRKKKKDKMGLGSLSRVFARGKQRKSLDPGLFDGTSTPDYYIEEDADW